MSRAADLDRARKNYIRRRTIRRLVTLALAVGAASAVYLFRFEIAAQGLGALFSDTLASVFDNTGYPVELDAPPLQLTRVGRRAVAVGDGLLSVYNTAGNQVVSARLSGKNPIAVPAGKRLLVYSQGGYALSLFLGETVLYKQEFTQPIYTAALSPSGVCAVSTGAVGYQSQITVLDDQYKRLFEWASAESIVTVLALDGGGGVCVAGSLHSEGGILSSTLRLFELSGGLERWTRPLPDELLLAARVAESGAVTAVSDGAVTFLSAEGNVIRRHDFDGETLDAFYIHPDGSVDLALGAYASTHRMQLVRLDLQGKPTARSDVDFAVRRLIPYGEELLAFTGDRTMLLSPKLMLLRSIETPDASHAEAFGDYLYYATAEELSRTPLR